MPVPPTNAMFVPFGFTDSPMPMGPLTNQLGWFSSGN